MSAIDFTKVTSWITPFSNNISCEKVESNALTAITGDTWTEIWPNIEEKEITFTPEFVSVKDAYSTKIRRLLNPISDDTLWCYTPYGFYVGLTNTSGKVLNKDTTTITFSVPKAAMDFKLYYYGQYKHEWGWVSAWLSNIGFWQEEGGGTYAINDMPSATNTWTITDSDWLPGETRYFNFSVNGMIRTIGWNPADGDRVKSDDALSFTDIRLKSYSVTCAGKYYQRGGA